MTFNLGSLLSSDPDEPLGFFLVSQPIDQVSNSGVHSFRSLWSSFLLLRAEDNRYDHR